MTGRTFLLRFFALIFAIACVSFAIVSLYGLLSDATSSRQAPLYMAGITAAITVLLLGLAHLRATRRRAKLNAIMVDLIDHKPMAGLAAAMVAGAAARFGIDPEDLFPVFEAFSEERKSPTKATSSPNH
jgi:NAD/NADP transhydrogenase beta subunit